MAQSVSVCVGGGCGWGGNWLLVYSTCIWKRNKLLYVVGLLRAVGDHGPRLLDPFLEAGRRGRGGRFHSRLFPGGHLGVLAGGRLEALQRLVEGGTRLNGGLHEVVVGGGVGRRVGLGGGVVGPGLGVVWAGCVHLHQGTRVSWGKLISISIDG